MQICEDHWDKLRQAIHDRGLSHLVSRDGDEVANRMKAELEGRASVFTWDPLLDVNNRIMCRALEVGGLAMLHPKEDGKPRCPICHAMEHSGEPKGTEKHWIQGPASAALEYARQEGVYPTP